VFHFLQRPYVSETVETDETDETPETRETLGLALGLWAWAFGLWSLVLGLGYLHLRILNSDISLLASCFLLLTIGHCSSIPANGLWLTANGLKHPNTAKKPLRSLRSLR